MNNLFEPVFTVECWNQFNTVDENNNERKVLHHIDGDENNYDMDNLIWISNEEASQIAFHKKFGHINFNVPTFAEVLQNFKRK